MLATVTLNDEERTGALRRLEILDVLVAAMERRSEVFETIVSSTSADAARVAVATLLGTSQIGATAVLDLQWRRLAELERAKILEERDLIRARLA